MTPEGGDEAAVDAFFTALGGRRIETACNRVYLAGDTAWKVKRPVDLGYVDFTTLERRRQAAEREIAFNARRQWKKFQTIVQDVHTDRPNTPVSLTELRKRIEAREVDLFDVGGCGCFVTDGDDSE